MDNTFVCEPCKKEFKSKNMLTRHMNKKIPCTKTNDIKNNVEVYTDIKSPLTRMFKGCLDLIRTNEGITGDTALRNMSYLLILKLIEPHLGTSIDIDNYEYIFEDVEIDYIAEHRSIMMDIVHYSKLMEVKEQNLLTNIRFLWNGILSQHNATNRIFNKNKGFDFKYSSTFVQLMKKINTVDIFTLDYDILGEAYEEVIQDIMVGKVLGQYFTPPIVKNLMIELVNPHIYEDGKIESCGDPAMGTGGFLITYLKFIKKKATENKINIDWDCVKNNIYGKEINIDTYQLAISNMLITTGKMFEQLDHGDSIRVPIDRKFDIVLANPPFGVKGIRYTDIKDEKRRVHFPIETNNSVLLFIQTIIYMLNINGRCAIVLPDGETLSGKDTASVYVRKYLMKTCELKEVINLHKVFANAAVGTRVLYFIKKIETSTVLDIKNTGKKKTYTFLDVHHTTNVKFYDYDITTKVKTLSVEVPIDKIADNMYSLNCIEYIEIIDDIYDDTVEVKRLGDICEIRYGTRIVKKKINTGKYNVYGSGEPSFLTDTFNRSGFNIIVGRFALSLNCVRVIYDENLFLNDSGLTIHSISTNVLDKYIGYYLLQKQNIIYNCSKGMAQKNLDCKRFKSIKIPLPPLAVQNTIVSKLDRIYESITISNNTIETYLDTNKRQIQRVSIIDHKLIALGELCMFLPKSKRPASYGKKEGKYKFYVSSMNSKFCDENDYKEECLIIGDGGEPNVNYDTNFSTSDHCIVLRNRNNQALNLKYVYYYIFNNLGYMKNLYIGMGLKNITKPRVSNIKIRIPPLEIQNQIVAACDRRNEMIANLETFIEELKQETKEILSDALRNAPAEPDAEEVNNNEEHDEKADSDELLE
jgi:type I restriction-modification system DNA methylase subunit